MPFHRLSVAERRHGSTRVPDHAFLACCCSWLSSVYCTFRNRSALDQGKWRGPSGQAAWTGYRVKIHTLLGRSPSASQAGRRMLGQPSSLRPHWSVDPHDDAAEGVVQRFDPALCFTCIQLWTENGEGGWCVFTITKTRWCVTLVKKLNCLLSGTNPEPHRREVREGTKVGYLFAKYLSRVFWRKEKNLWQKSNIFLRVTEDSLPSSNRSFQPSRTKTSSSSKYVCIV